MDGFIGGFLAVFFICLTTVAIYVVGRVYDHKEIMAGKRTAFPASILPVEDALRLDGNAYHCSETVRDPFAEDPDEALHAKGTYAGKSK